MLAVLHNGRIRLNLNCPRFRISTPSNLIRPSSLDTPQRSGFTKFVGKLFKSVLDSVLLSGEYLLGHVDEGETDFDAALRETLEEAGLSKNDLKIETSFCKVLNYPVKGRPKTVTYWLAELCGQKQVTLSSEHQDYKWVKLEEACKLAAHPDMQSVLKECEEYLKNNK